MNSYLYVTLFFKGGLVRIYCNKCSNSSSTLWPQRSNLQLGKLTWPKWWDASLILFITQLNSNAFFLLIKPNMTAKIITLSKPNQPIYICNWSNKHIFLPPNTWTYVLKACTTEPNIWENQYWHAFFFFFFTLVWDIRKYFNNNNEKHFTYSVSQRLLLPYPPSTARWWKEWCCWSLRCRDSLLYSCFWPQETIILPQFWWICLPCLQF